MDGNTYNNRLLSTWGITTCGIYSFHIISLSPSQPLPLECLVHYLSRIIIDPLYPTERVDNIYSSPPVTLMYSGSETNSASVDHTANSRWAPPAATTGLFNDYNRVKRERNTELSLCERSNNNSKKLCSTNSV